MIVAPAYAFAQVELSFYAGAQSVQSSNVAIRDTLSPSTDVAFARAGRSIDAPPFYGIRATRWRSDTFGVGLDFARNHGHSLRVPHDYAFLELGDGLNTFTVNAYRRWNDVVGALTPYVGGGIGIAVPLVEVNNELSDTSVHQMTGPAATWVAGASLPLNDQWSVFGEYKGTFSASTTELDSGGMLETDILTNALNVGVSFNF
jgi:lipid A oxidase